MCETEEGGGLFKPVFMGVEDVPTAISVLCPHGRSFHWLLRVLRAYVHTADEYRQALPWALGLWRKMCQFSVLQAAFQPGSSEDLLEYRLLAFSLASELFVAPTDMKINYWRGMIFLLSKKSGFCLSYERAVVIVVFFPITSLNFSCAVVFKSKAGDWQAV